jgi:hypothetical protein
MKFLICWISLFYSVVFFGQDSQSIFDRPGIADSPYLVPKKSNYLELGLGITGKTDAQDLLFPSILFRKRLGKTNEVRIATSTFPQSFQLIKDVIDIHPLVGSLGLKQKIFKENKFIPESAIMINSYFNFSSKNGLRLSNFILESQLLFNSNVNEWFSINYNVGYIHNVTQKQNYIHQSTCFTFQLTKRTSTFIESFNYFSIFKKSNELSYDFGFTHYISNDMQLDLSYIANNNLDIHYGTVLIGISLNL